MKKSFKLTHKPGQSQTPGSRTSVPTLDSVTEEATPSVSLKPSILLTRSHSSSVMNGLRSSQASVEADAVLTHGSPTTRKTIEVPEEYFFRVKMHALQRRIKEKDMWAEILEEYFAKHPNPE